MRKRRGFSAEERSCRVTRSGRRFSNPRRITAVGLRARPGFSCSGGHRGRTRSIWPWLRRPNGWRRRPAWRSRIRREIVTWEMVRDRYRRVGLEAKVEPFLFSMDRVMREADVIVCRGGGNDAGRADGIRSPVDSRAATYGDRRSPAPKRPHAGGEGCGTDDRTARAHGRPAGRRDTGARRRCGQASRDEHVGQANESTQRS